MTLPTTATEVTGNTISNPKQATFDRIRLSYGEIDSITDKDGNALSANGATGTLSYSYTDAAGVTQTDGELKVTVYDTFEDWAKHPRLRTTPTISQTVKRYLLRRAVS